MIEKPDGRSEAPSEIDVSDVGATLAALNVWLNQAKKLFAGPIDIAFMNARNYSYCFCSMGSAL